MRHISDGALRRLDDEPLAVPDRVTDHVATCERCNARRAQIARDAEQAAQLFSAPRLVPDVDAAWTRLQRELESGQTRGKVRHGQPKVAHSRRLPSVSLRSGLAVGAVAIVVAGSAAAATLTNIFQPTHVVPVSVSQRDLRAIAALTGLTNRHALSGFSTPSGSKALRFGTITWASGPPLRVSTLVQAEDASGLPITLPAHLPVGVGRVQQYDVQPRLTATVRFSSAAATLAGSTVALEAGPAVIAQYGGAGGNDAPTLSVLTMRRPTARATGATLSQIEAFLLSQRIPPQLAEEIRLLGNLRTALPVPVPSGASVRSVQVGGWPGVLLADSSNAVSAVVWEDGGGLLHAVGGILDSRDVLNAAAELG